MLFGEGPGAIEFEHLGNAAHALQNALLQSVPPSVEKEPINTVFPAWPKGWDAQFTPRRARRLSYQRVEAER